MKKYTYSARDTDNPGKWCVVDANDKILGRLATQVAMRLRGKHRPLYTPHADTGDGVIVINADKIRLTGNKLNQKNYYRHSGYVGGLKTTPARVMFEKNPEEMIRIAVKGMLPKNRMGRKLMKKLRVYKGETHPHTAQQPELVEI